MGLSWPRIGSCCTRLCGQRPCCAGLLPAAAARLGPSDARRCVVSTRRPSGRKLTRIPHPHQVCREVHDGLVVVDTVAAWLTFSRAAVTAGDALRYGCLSHQFRIHSRPFRRTPVPRSFATAIRGIPFHSDHSGTANPWNRRWLCEDSLKTSWVGAQLRAAP
jgi:hypothetical protein